MSDAAQLGGGYAESQPRPKATAVAVLQAAQPGANTARLVLISGPPGVGKSTVAARLLKLMPHAIWLDKDDTAAGFILAAAHQNGIAPQAAYGTDHYWDHLRPLEYAGPFTVACANLVGHRTVLLSGGWGPELAHADLWPQLSTAIAPTPLVVIHLDAPPLSTWRQRLAARGSRTDSPWFEQFAQTLTQLPVWTGANRINTDQPIHQVTQDILNILV